MHARKLLIHNQHASRLNRPARRALERQAMAGTSFKINRGSIEIRCFKNKNDNNIIIGESSGGGREGGESGEYDRGEKSKEWTEKCHTLGARTDRAFTSGFVIGTLASVLGATPKSPSSKSILRRKKRRQKV